MANRKMTYADLLKDKGTYAVKARREKYLAKSAKHRAALAAALAGWDKADEADLKSFEATINDCNAAAVAAIPLLPKKPKVDEIVVPPADAPTPDGTPVVEIVDGVEVVALETDTEALTAIAAETFADETLAEVIVEADVPALTVE